MEQGNKIQDRRDAQELKRTRAHIIGLMLSYEAWKLWREAYDEDEGIDPYKVMVHETFAEWERSVVPELRKGLENMPFFDLYMEFISNWCILDINAGLRV